MTVFSAAVTPDEVLTERLSLADLEARLSVRVVVRELANLDLNDDELVDCIASGDRVLFVGLWRRLAFVGPVWRPDEPGCPLCLAGRVLDPSELSARSGDGVPAGPGARRSTISPAGLGIVQAVATSWTGISSPREVVVIDDRAGSVSVHPLLPMSTCRLCGSSTPSEPPELTPATFPLTKVSSRSLRTRRLDTAGLRRSYLSPTLGLFKEIKQDLQSPFGAASVELTSPWGRREPGIGRALSFDSSQGIAILEGLERLAGLHRGGRLPTVRASYSEVSDIALDPRRLGVHPRESYDLPDFKHRPFDESVVVDWVGARSLLDGGYRLVPERAAFWGPRHDGEPTFFYDTSNGCALGSSLEEAVVHGLREVAERDAYLLTWYRGLALPEVAWEGRDPEIDELVKRARLFTGFSVRIFQATMEYRVPTVLIVATRSDGSTEGPVTFMGAAAHPDPMQAITGGLYELIGTIMATSYAFADGRPQALRMLEDPTLIRSMEHHSLVGSLPEARDRFDFLLAAPPEVIELEELPSTVTEGEDIRGDLGLMLDGFRQAGLEVLVVDQTMPEHAPAGAHCVRVLVPGLLPMTFGHRNRRTVGLPRLLGPAPYRATVTDPDLIGVTPHPFP